MSMYLVTGGAGFIGSHLVRQLVDQGEDVRILDNFSTGRRENLASMVRSIEVIEGDVRDSAAVADAMNGVDVVLHQAAQTSVPRSVEDPWTTMDVNVMGTLNVLTAAQRARCQRVVLASTCAVYGDRPQGIMTESVCPDPLSPYAVSKLTGEQLCASFTRLHGLETVALRYFNVFGPGQDPSGGYAAVIPRFLAALHAEAPLVIFGDGTQTRDFVFVGNVVDANLLAATTTGVAGGVFNIASGQSISLNRMVSVLADAIGQPIFPHYQPARPGDIRHSRADISAAQASLGYRVRVPFVDGLLRTINSDSDAVLAAVGDTAPSLDRLPALSTALEA